MEKVADTKTKKQSKQMTLLSAIERVARLSKDSKLSATLFKKAHREISFLAKQYGISEEQAVLFSVCLEVGPRRIDCDDMARYLNMNKLQFMMQASDIDALVRRRLIRYLDVSEEDDFSVPGVVLKSLKHNEVYELPKRTGLDCASFFELLCSLFNDLNDDAVSAHELSKELEEVVANNQQMLIAQRIKELHLDSGNLLLLLLFCHYLVNRDDDDIRFNQIGCAFNYRREFLNARNEMRSGEHVLMQLKLIEFRCEDGIANNQAFRLTESAKRDLLSELNIKTTDVKLANVLNPSDITQKTMFYTDDIAEQVDELASFFEPEKYAQIKERMREQGLRCGFACLFYGGPGTGKTETVYQLARQTGRSIMMVDMPQIKSKWVGDSEKNIKAVFDRYRDIVKRSEKAPILLFNEADAIIGARMSGAERAVDKMENSIQNIILQEMENLDGILIATTNLVENLDSAFERRFLYKIRFSAPDAKVR
ncbi:MAG: AAA family ATPase [Muribaculaceae bacterium]|nr:AAA family ATPase [Muribaculaceae bacterium]